MHAWHGDQEKLPHGHEEGSPSSVIAHIQGVSQRVLCHAGFQGYHLMHVSEMAINSLMAVTL